MPVTYGFCEFKRDGCTYYSRGFHGSSFTVQTYRDGFDVLDNLNHPFWEV
ncbi:unnamed protein product [Arabidopsis lyrata]|uniref:Predicted protein n=1 Tax=Arabidopsis lyrata subsp. lyrata TaxID=81972 RepID=D7KRD6_ARALL|nr:predicted protein [Arabidopsis lyrata subsp. lyrata]CAH8278442.1 unnamed protein product [Arabidopsis lyrata]